MNGPLRLVLFDVDGTLVDSQAGILGAMEAAFEAVDMAPPDRETVLGIVGLSLPLAIQRLGPDLSAVMHQRMEAAYREAYFTQRAELGAGHSPLYPGALEILDRLHGTPEILMGVATGKSQRGLDALIEAHGLERYFVTRQCADHHPSKPHPSMIATALSETGVAPEGAIMVGDTSFDMDMAAAAGIAGIGVSWGYHRPAALSGARRVIDGFEALPGALDEIWKESLA
ncbi:HAD-IA family hydrolase [Lutimaribacter marinistellae]|uniref:HAD-IA family hydrolase n=1 Tax=Lutimaribacter marinistellae TaxID=1820329 RepID=A0ABV7TLA2_9RHOB